MLKFRYFFASFFYFSTRTSHRTPDFLILNERGEKNTHFKIKKSKIFGGVFGSIRLWRSKNREIEKFGKSKNLGFEIFSFFCGQLLGEGSKNGFYIKIIKKKFRVPKKISGSKKKSGVRFFFLTFFVDFFWAHTQKIRFQTPSYKKLQNPAHP